MGKVNMCHYCVIEQVKDQMLSRRCLVRSVTAAAAAVTLGSAAEAQVPTPGVAVSSRGARDLTHELYPDFPTFFGDQQLKIEEKLSFAKDGLNLKEYVLNEHTGTHIDAPLHFSRDGKSVAELPLDDLVVPLAVIDIRAKAASNPDAQVTPGDIKAWIARNGPIPEKACVAMNSGWSDLLAHSKF